MPNKEEQKFLKAAEDGDVETVESLVKSNININAITMDETTIPEKKTALHLTIIGAHLKVARILVNHGINTQAETFQGLTALHLTESLLTSTLQNLTQCNWPTYKPILQTKCKNLLLIQDELVLAEIEQGNEVGLDFNKNSIHRWKQSFIFGLNHKKPAHQKQSNTQGHNILIL